MKEVVKRLKCDKCNKVIQASNKFNDERFYCMKCGRNLGIKMKKQIKPFTEKCICSWSKDDEYGFISNVKCSVHGKKAKEFIDGLRNRKDSMQEAITHVKRIKLAKEEQKREKEINKKYNPFPNVEIYQDWIDKQEKVKCIYCKKPIKLRDWAGLNKKGSFCKFCFQKRRRKIEEENKRGIKNTGELK